MAFCVLCAHYIGNYKLYVDWIENQLRVYRFLYIYIYVFIHLKYSENPRIFSQAFHTRPLRLSFSPPALIVKVSWVLNRAVGLNYNGLVNGVTRGSNRISVRLVEIGLIVSSGGLIF